MPIACCKYYGNFINEDKSIDKDFLTKHFGENAEVVIEEVKEGEWADFVFSKHGHYPKYTFVISDQEKTELCVCPCHNKTGPVVMH